MDTNEMLDLKIFSARMRKGICTAIGSAGSGHVGGSMSIVEVLAVLYGKVARVDANAPDWPDRDRIVLSKGHAGPALYAALALKGFIPEEDLVTLNKDNTRLPSHADRTKTPGIDFSTGPLGQGISMAVGSALGARRLGKEYTTYGIIGDGECDEGQVWEAALFAAHHKVANLIVFLDNNGQQVDGCVEDVCNLGDLGHKFTEFDWFVQEVDGHDVSAIEEAIGKAKAQTEKPNIIVLKTVKGKGCKKALDLGLCHYMPFSEEEAAAECLRLDEEIAKLESQRR